MSLLPSSLYIMRLTLGYYPKCSPLSLPFLNLCPTPSWRSERKLDCCIHNQSPLVCKDIRLRKNVHNRWGDAFQMSADENFFCRFSHIYQDLWICGWCRKVDLSEGGNWICTSSTSSSQSSLMSLPPPPPQPSKHFDSTLHTEIYENGNFMLCDVFY